jgi:hypothetical protein
MGYHTDFSLEIEPEDLWQEIDEALQEITKPDSDLQDFEAFGDGWVLSDTTWYTHEEELKDFSRHFSETLFILTGEGDESDDRWKLYVKNGKVWRATGQVEVVFPPFSEDKLR